MKLHDLTETFQSIFNTDQTPRAFFAPGRINLIGEHTDYNGGHVFPAAISFGTYAVAARRSDNKIRFYSINFKDIGIVECELSNLDYNKAHHWANFPKGMLQYFQKEGYTLSTGFDLLIYGNIPNGAGLSSSASIELVTGVMLEKLYHLNVDRIRMIQIGQLVENNYIGVNTGIMDQFAIGKAKEDHAILLDCQTLAHQYAPLDLQNHVIMIINTNKRRELAESKYNERRKQCEQALLDLQTELSINSLGDLTPEAFEKNKHLIQNAVNQKRAKHAVYENHRTLEAFDKLKQHDLRSFGQLMNHSHLSLQHDYEVTGVELDTIVEAAWKQEGVLGARMTGAGFGGCALAIVHQDHLVGFQQNIKQSYYEKIGYYPTFYIATIGAGAKEMTSEGVF
ncbi:galactokinase [Aquibacillus koreensis]|uniref:Galactokinase n=1 Tax=Aquibacillus koreensis TaxID=279446 RepID=A0A9X3WP28_9BACI|nr:galactokinase [Aquibacillus koreensis]MCT2535443.1 galactokinase [Aquibacillus koreensis]MDC3422278.1 galactokinase [Aquibacillus koreensis]